MLTTQHRMKQKITNRAFEIQIDFQVFVICKRFHASLNFHIRNSVYSAMVTAAAPFPTQQIMFRLKSNGKQFEYFEQQTHLMELQIRNFQSEFSINSGFSICCFYFENRQCLLCAKYVKRFDYIQLAVSTENLIHLILWINLKFATMFYDLSK